MNSKYINFSIILIVLSVFDILTTQYALKTYPHLSEGNPIMALVTSSFFLFVLVKAVGVLIIVNIYKRIRTQSEIASKIGQTLIIMMMLFVVGNNLVVIGSATVYGVQTPYGMTMPGDVFDGTSTTDFLLANGSFTQGFGCMENETFFSIAGCGSTKRLIGGGTKIRFAITDWTTNQQLFFIDSDKKVGRVVGNQVNYSAGWYDPGDFELGCSLSGNCNPMYLIDTLTNSVTNGAGFVDSDGDLYLADGATVYKYTRSLEYSKSTVFTVPNPSASCQFAGGTFTYEIVDMKLDSNGYIHLFIGSTASQYYTGSSHYCDASGSYYVYSGTGIIYSIVNGWSQHEQVGAYATANPKLTNSAFLLDKNGNTTANFTLAYSIAGSVALNHYNNTGIATSICAGACSGITQVQDMVFHTNYVYISSLTQNAIYSFPTTFSSSIGSGYTGIGAESTDLPDITYTEKSINSMYANYYNTSKFSIQAKINFASGNWPTSVNYGINDQAYRWQIKLIDPNGVTVNSWDTGECDDSGITHCELSILQEYTAPSIGWQSGNWYVKLYEHKIDDTLFGAAAKGNLALLTTSATWNVLNASTNTTGIISDPTESINSPSGLTTISQIDAYVGLLGFGVNSVSKFLFALIFAVVLFVIGMYYGKSGMIGLALSSFPYVFFAYIGYIPKWVFIIYVILLIVISRVFR